MRPDGGWKMSGGPQTLLLRRYRRAARGPTQWAIEVLAQSRPVLERCVQALLAQETLDADALRALTA
jgi:hypothetical protein